MLIYQSQDEANKIRKQRQRKSDMKTIPGVSAEKISPTGSRRRSGFLILETYIFYSGINFFAVFFRANYFESLMYFESPLSFPRCFHL